MIQIIIIMFAVMQMMMIGVKTSLVTDIVFFYTCDFCQEIYCIPAAEQRGGSRSKEKFLFKFLRFQLKFPSEWQLLHLVIDELQMNWKSQTFVFLPKLAAAAFQLSNCNSQFPHHLKRLIFSVYKLITFTFCWQLSPPFHFSQWATSSNFQI